MALLTEAEVQAIQGRLEGFYGWVSSDPKEDCNALFADREERTRLLREVLNGNYMQHNSECLKQRILSTFVDTSGLICVCGLDTFLAEIQKAIEAQP